MKGQYSLLIKDFFIYIDASWSDFGRALRGSLKIDSLNRDELQSRLSEQWKTKENPNPSAAFLSVRTALDLYLQVMSFPEGSEVIMSSINIPDMCAIVRRHKLKIVSWDINIDDVTPKWQLLNSLITSNTKLVIVAYIYGKVFDVSPLLDVTEDLGIPVIEDCAEGNFASGTINF